MTRSFTIEEKGYPHLPSMMRERPITLIAVCIVAGCTVLNIPDTGFLVQARIG